MRQTPNKFQCPGGVFLISCRHAEWSGTKADPLNDRVSVFISGPGLGSRTLDYFEAAFGDNITFYDNCRGNGGGGHFRTDGSGVRSGFRI